MSSRIGTQSSREDTISKHERMENEQLDVPTGASRNIRRFLWIGLVTTAFTWYTVSDIVRIETDHEYEFWYTILFVAGFVGLPLFLVLKCIVQVEHPDYSDFDTIVETVAKSVQPDEEQIQVDKKQQTLKTPLLQSAPPLDATSFHVTNKQNSILSKKT